MQEKDYDKQAYRNAKYSQQDGILRMIAARTAGMQFLAVRRHGSTVLQWFKTLHFQVVAS